MIDITREAAADRIALFAKEGRLIQHKWQDSEPDGRELACLLGAIHPNIRSPGDCPAAVMPAWLASVLPTLFDGVRLWRVDTFGLRFAAALRGGKFDDRVMYAWLYRVVRFALDEARPAGNPPAYWIYVERACKSIVTNLRKGETTSQTELLAAESECRAAIAINGSQAVKEAVRAVESAAQATMVADQDVSFWVREALEATCLTVNAAAAGKTPGPTAFAEPLFEALLECMA